MFCFYPPDSVRWTCENIEHSRDCVMELDGAVRMGVAPFSDRMRFIGTFRPQPVRADLSQDVVALERKGEAASRSAMP